MPDLEPTIQIHCPGCQKLLFIPRNCAGASGTCNHCQTYFSIPTQSPFRDRWIAAKTYMRKKQLARATYKAEKKNYAKWMQETNQGLARQDQNMLPMPATPQTVEYLREIGAPENELHGITTKEADQLIKYYLRNSFAPGKQPVCVHCGGIMETAHQKADGAGGCLLIIGGVVIAFFIPFIGWIIGATLIVLGVVRGQAQTKNFLRCKNCGALVPRG